MGDHKLTREQLALAVLVQAELDRIDDEDRQYYIQRLHSGWCERCGNRIPERYAFCYCRRDD